MDFKTLFLSLLIFSILIGNQEELCYGNNSKPDDKLSTQNKEFQFNIEQAKAITNGKKSLEYSLKAYEIAKKMGSKFNLARACNEISFDYERIGDLMKALYYTLLAAKLYEEINDEIRCGVIYNRIGTIYYTQGNQILAIVYLKKALEVHKKLNAMISIGEDYNNLGEVYRLTKQYDKAMDCFRQSLGIFSRMVKDKRFAYSAGNIGLVFAAQNKMDSANYYITLSTNKLKQKGDNNPIAIYLIEMANIYFRQGNTDESLRKAKEALKISTNENFREQLRDVNHLLVDIYARKNDFKNAFQALNEYHKHKDSISNSNVISNMAEMRADYEIAKKETEIKGLQAMNSLRLKINLGLSIGIALIIIFTIGLFRLNKNLKKVNQILASQKIELEQKNEIIRAALTEKETLLKEIHHRVKNNLQIISSLLSLQSQNVKNKKILNAFSESQQRLHSIALIHQKLYQNEKLSNLNIKEYISDLTTVIGQAFSVKQKNITCHLGVKDISVDIDTAVPIGLMINELVTNAYKHAFNNTERGDVFVSLEELENKYELVVKDNGQGLPEKFNMADTESLGLRLVNILAKQLKGEMEVKNEKGAAFYLRFCDDNSLQA